jgi:hypothetical protein
MKRGCIKLGEDRKGDRPAQEAQFEARHPWWPKTLLRPKKHTTMTRYFILALALLAAQPALGAPPGWYETGGWQCGPHVRIITSIDGGDGIDFFVIGAWFDNHYTLRRGQFYYNGVPCAAFGHPFGPPPPRRRCDPMMEGCND